MKSNHQVSGSSLLEILLFGIFSEHLCHRDIPLLSKGQIPSAPHICTVSCWAPLLSIKIIFFSERWRKMEGKNTGEQAETRTGTAMGICGVIPAVTSVLPGGWQHILYSLLPRGAGQCAEMIWGGLSIGLLSGKCLLGNGKRILGRTLASEALVSSPRGSDSSSWNGSRCVKSNSKHGHR